MFQVRDLSVKVFAQEEALVPLLACNVCNSTPGLTCGITAEEAPLLACNVCDSTPGRPQCGITGPEGLEIRREGLDLLRRQLRSELAELN